MSEMSPSARVAFEGKLKALSESEMHSLHAEIGRELNRIVSKARAKRDLLTMIKKELENRKEERRKNDGFLITDHAIIRYLERHKGLDIESIRSEIFALAKAGKEIDGSDHVRNGSAVLVVVKKDKAITTILNEDESEMINS